MTVFLTFLQNPTFMFIQGDSGGKVNILGGEIIGNYEKKISCGHICYSAYLPRWSCSNFQT